VIADPELTTTQLGPQHAFLILATDGIWEFISSQKAVEMVARHDNPYDAAKALVAQAYKLWLQKETRTDDISCVVAFLEWPAEAAAAAQQAQQQAAAAAEASAGQQQQGAQPAAQITRTPSGKSVRAASEPSSTAVTISASA
jgi:serine/threonine protein phosphatase PrpC